MNITGGKHTHSLVEGESAFFGRWTTAVEVSEAAAAGLARPSLSLFIVEEEVEVESGFAESAPSEADSNTSVQ